MPVGFACTSQTATSVADEYLLVRKNYFEELKKVKDQNRKGLGDFSDFLSNLTRDEILNPAKYDPEAFDTSEFDGFPVIGYNSKCFIDFGIGNFRLNFRRDEYEKKYGVLLTLSVRVGEKFIYHPQVIKEKMIENFDLETYNLWRQNIKDSIEDAKDVVRIARSLMTKNNMNLAQSALCCKSSERFCKSVGLFVHRGRAFLLPEKYNY